MWTFGWLVHQINPIYEVPKLKQNFINFILPILFVLTLASDRAVLKGNVMLSIFQLKKVAPVF